MSQDDAAEVINVLTMRDAMRKRPAMHVGSTGTLGLHNLVFNIASDAINHSILYGGKELSVTLNADGSASLAYDVASFSIHPASTERPYIEDAFSSEADLNPNSLASSSALSGDRFINVIFLVSK